MPQVNYNERSWAIDLISDCNLWLHGRDLTIVRAGGEHTLRGDEGSLFPDVLLFGDQQSGTILQGWELKMPDTPIDDPELLDNAAKKARALSLNSFLVWNVSEAALYVLEGDGIRQIKSWQDLKFIREREEVLAHRKEITQLLGQILEEINEFLAAGIIRPATIVDSITGEGMVDSLMANLPAYANSLERHANADSAFENEVSLWWLAAKNDFPEESNKYMVLARNNMVTLFNKFIFAHALKQFNNHAGLVDGITRETTIAEALQTFEQISAKADFWNIFSQNLGESALPPASWTNLRDLNEILKDFRVSSIDLSILHDLLDRLVLRSKRKLAGQFATPAPLANLLATLLVSDASLPVLDPCCGTGTIAKAVYSYKKQKGIAEPLKTVWASDKFALPLKMATLSMAQPEDMGQLLRVFKHDAVTLRPGEPVTLHDPFDGSAVEEKLPQFPYILSNLPFVQQENLGRLNPGVSGINDFIAAKSGDTTLKLDQRSDLYAYLPFYFWNLLSDGGSLGIIISNSWLATDMGEKFFACLMRFYRVRAIITSGKGRWFDNAKVVTNIVVLDKIDDPSVRVEQEIKYVMLRKPLDELNDPETLVQVRALIQSASLPPNDLVSITTVTQQQLEYLRGIGLPASAYFAGLEWLHEAEHKTIKAADLYNINRGERGGWDPLFFPRDLSAVEAEYRRPILKSPQSVKQLIAAPNREAFYCTVAEDELERRGHTGALAWVRRFATEMNGQNQLLPVAFAGYHPYWYSLASNTVADIATAVNYGDRLFYCRFEEPAFVGQRFIRFTRKDGSVDNELCHALCSSVFGLFYLEALGFGRGEGALDLSAKKLARSLRMLDPSLLSEDAKQKILAAFQPLLAREIKPIAAELADQERAKFDAVVLEAYGLGHLQAAITDSLLTLYRIRCAVNK